MSLRTLLEEIRRAPTMEASARHLLLALAEHGSATLGNPFRPVELHRLTLSRVREGAFCGVHELPILDSSGAAIISTSALRALQADREPVWLDVVEGALHRVGGRGDSEAQVDPQLLHGLTRNMTRRSQATHLLAIAVPDVHDRLGGLLAIELESIEERHRPLEGWSDFAERALPWIEAAGPVVLCKPGAVRAQGVHLSADMAQVEHLIERYARSTHPILLKGESGAGKTHHAELIHRRSARSGAFVKVRLSGPKDLASASLFGWRRGAYTGANTDEPGLIAKAEGGTVFIDELQNLSPGHQQQLLQVTQEKTYRRLGDTDERQADVRFVFATNLELEGNSGFHQDLLARIGHLPIHLPPLRDRLEDLPHLARGFLMREAQDSGHQGPVAISPFAVNLLEAQPWPNNLHDLKGTIERSWLLSRPDDVQASFTLGVPELMMALESGRPQRSYGTAKLLREAAESLYEEILRRRGAPEGPGWADIEVMQGLVLEVAQQHAHGNTREAFRALGAEALVRNNNASRTAREALGALEALRVKLGFRQSQE